MACRQCVFGIAIFLLTSGCAIDQTLRSINTRPAPDFPQVLAAPVASSSLKAAPTLAARGSNLAPPISPARTIGWTVDKLTEAFGAPDYIRREGLGTVYQYRLDYCIIDFTLYPRQQQNMVIAWHSRPLKTGDIVESTVCYRDLARRSPVADSQS